MTAPRTTVAGKAYFISNGEPLPLWDLVNRLLAAAGLPPVTRTVPYPLAWAAAWLFEKTYRLSGRTEEPPLTRFLVHELTTAHWFDLAAARRELGYVPKISIDEGLRRLAACFGTDQ